MPKIRFVLADMGLCVPFRVRVGWLGEARDPSWNALSFASALRPIPLHGL